jgi:MFS transporter, FHS family, Na+ dependent glucose transporter 1
VLFRSVMVLLGVAEGALGVGGNALLVWVHQNRVAPFMNALHFTYGVGAFIAPLIIAKAVSIRNTTAAPYFALALLIVPAAALLFAVPSPQQPRTDDGHSEAGQIKYMVVLLIATLLCLDVGAEVSYGSWIFSYVLKMNLGDEKMAAYLTSFFWGSLTVGRLIGVPIAARFSPRAILLTDLAGCLISIGIALMWPTSLAAITTASVCVGLSLASVYPTALTFAQKQMKITGQVTSFLLIGGSFGGMTVPLAIGQLFESVGPRVLMFAMLVDLMAAVLVYMALVLASSASARARALPR